MPFSRRKFVSAAAMTAGWTVLPTSLAAAPETKKLTVGEVVERIKQHVGVPWTNPTVDSILAGSESTVVRGVATTMMATFEVCKRAQAAGCNFIITHETPFYLHQDHTEDIAENPVLLAKKAFLADHNMAILHLHDHLHAMHPDGVAKGMVDQLGWSKNVNDPDDPKRLHFEGVPLQQLVRQMAIKLDARTIRVIGDPRLPVHQVVTSWGYCSREGGIKLMSAPEIEVLICGETREWELVEYAQDAITAGQKKALVVVGHVLSEQGGMQFATAWLKGFVTEVPVVFVPAPEPFWLATA